MYNFKKNTPIKEGDTLRIGGIDWIVYAAPRGALVQCIAAESLEKRPFDRAQVNIFSRSELRSYLNNEFFKEIIGCEATEKAFRCLKISTECAYDAGHFRTAHCRIGLLTCEEYKKFSKNIPPLSEPWWTMTPSTQNGGIVQVVFPDGAVRPVRVEDGNAGVRPVCRINLYEIERSAVVQDIANAMRRYNISAKDIETLIA